MLEVREDDVVDVEPTAAGARIWPARSEPVGADAVVLALGIVPPRFPDGLIGPGAEDRCLANPWDAAALARIEPSATVTLVGAGLSQLLVEPITGRANFWSSQFLAELVRLALRNQDGLREDEPYLIVLHRFNYTDGNACTQGYVHQTADGRGRTALQRNAVVPVQAPCPCHMVGWGRRTLGRGRTPTYRT